MTMTVDWREGHLDLTFLNIDYTGAGDAGGLLGSVVPGDFFLSLHTSDPSTTGDQETNEVTTGVWPAYARQAVPRTAAGWIRDSGTNVMNNFAAVTYPGNVGTAVIITHVGCGTELSGAGRRMYTMAIQPTPQVPTGGILVELSPFVPTFLARELAFTAS